MIYLAALIMGLMIFFLVCIQLWQAAVEKLFLRVVVHTHTPHTLFLQHLIGVYDFDLIGQAQRPAVDQLQDLLLHWLR